jgi:glycosyltransferase involved in cell wall biosynthesis
MALGAPGFAVRSHHARSALDALGTVDAIIQIGATFRVDKSARRGRPLVIYADANAAYALRGRPWSSASHLSSDEVIALLARERSVYDGTDAVWTMSESLAASFVADFAVPASRVTTIGAGANLRNDADVGGGPGDGVPRVLFVGKEHERKGSKVLLEAFARVRSLLPGAELHVVGCDLDGLPQRGVTVHGFIAQDAPGGRARLAALYRSSTVFCLPSHYEPFGIVFLEAMAAGLPCIGTRSWAMPEIIADGDTGWLIPDGDVEALTRALSAALSDPHQSATMGAAGRARVQSHYTWGHVAARALDSLARHGVTDLRPSPLTSNSA